jgi:hypothetical protein
VPTLNSETQACQEAVQAAAAGTPAGGDRALKDGSFDRTPKGVIYRDIRVFSRLNFVYVSFLYCPRVCNRLAHYVVTFGVSRQETRSLWLESLPVDVHVPVTNMFAGSVD